MQLSLLTDRTVVKLGCEKGSNAWVEIPAAGQDAHKLKSPAARLDVLDVQAAGGHAH